MCCVNKRHMKISNVCQNHSRNIPENRPTLGLLWIELFSVSELHQMSTKTVTTVSLMVP